MIHYRIFQWLFFFYFYCFGGWCFESAYVSIRSRKLVNRGFMRGPFLPLYGSGAIMMLVVSMPFQDNVLLTYVAGVIGATALEYVTGVVIDALFEVRYWDYSGKRFNYQGLICLSSSLGWGFMTIFMTQVIHKPIEQFVLGIPYRQLSYVTALLTIYIVADFTLSFKAALNLRYILLKMQRVREEMERMSRRLDVLIAFNNEGKEQKRQERELSIGELRLGLQQRFASLKEHIQMRPSDYGEGVREEIAELRGKFSHYSDPEDNYEGMLDAFERDMIRNNPTMVSGKFKDVLDELKSFVSNRRGTSNK